MIFSLERKPLTMVIVFEGMFKPILNHLMISLLARPLVGGDFTLKEKLPSVLASNLLLLLEGFTRTMILTNFHTTDVDYFIF
jgi:hypothetical protein